MSSSPVQTTCLRVLSIDLRNEYASSIIILATPRVNVTCPRCLTFYLLFFYYNFSNFLRFAFKRSIILASDDIHTYIFYCNIVKQLRFERNFMESRMKNQRYFVSRETMFYAFRDSILINFFLHTSP